ncbi:MAG: hypothetical protein ACE5EH_11225 [Gammaproteobacteria bacterium]
MTALLLLSVFLIEYFSKDLGLIPGKSKYFIDALSIMASLMVVVYLVKNKEFYVSTKYLIIFLFFALIVLVGVIINNVDAGTAFFGLRTHLKYLPFFFLPAVSGISDNGLNKQLKLLLGLVLLQFPVVFFQRFVQYRGSRTGDVITGTVGESGVLTILLICAISVLIAFFARKRLGKPLFLLLMFLIFIPTTLNETKVTLVILPIAICVPIFFSARRHIDSMKKILPSIGLSALLFIVFIPIYNSFMREIDGGTIGNFVTNEKRLRGNFITDAQKLAPELRDSPGSNLPADTGTETTAPDTPVRRLDSILIPLQILSDDPIKLLVGLGVGNLSDTGISAFKGNYSYYFSEWGGRQTTISYLWWEVGILGVMLGTFFVFFVLRDAMYLRHREDTIGVLALGWVGVASVMAVILFYKNIIIFNVLGYLFWYFSGCIAAQRKRLEYRRDATLFAPFARKTKRFII